MLVIDAPKISPMIVNISRYMATLILPIFSLTYEEADPLEVAIIVTILAGYCILHRYSKKYKQGYDYTTTT